MNIHKCPFYYLIKSGYYQKGCQVPVKPANILFGKDDLWKLSDFGLVRSATESPTVNSIGGAGTVLYQAPEVARGAPGDNRSDLYALGMIIYRCLAGCEGLGRFPSLHQAVEGIPTWFGQLVDQLLDSEPAKRPGSAREVLAALKEKSKVGNYSGTGTIPLKPPTLTMPDKLEIRVPGTPIVGEEFTEQQTKMQMLWIPGGQFTMGDNKSKRETDKPAHPVQVSPFWLGKIPVTNQQYKVFIDDTGHKKPHYWDDSKFNDPIQPVVSVMWSDAQAFCKWLREKTGIAFTLPSEAQWEFAARGTDGRKYPWGNEEPDKKRACYGQNTDKPLPAGTLSAGKGPFGTLDQAGNVWEWCLDVWDKECYQKRVKQIPKGKTILDPLNKQGDKDYHVIRGGSWLSGVGDLDAAYRFWYRGDWFWNLYRGFRVAVPRPSTD